MGDKLREKNSKVYNLAKLDAVCINAVKVQWKKNTHTHTQKDEL